MKLLFDQNLSPKLAARLADLFPGSAHVQDEGLESASDERIWEYARIHGFAIVSKDVDFNNLSVLRGSPPQVIWLLLGNCTTQQIEAAIRAKAADVIAFENNHSTGTLIVR